MQNRNLPPNKYQWSIFDFYLVMKYDPLFGIQIKLLFHV
jgi:hypothetical protein